MWVKDFPGMKHVFFVVQGYDRVMLHGNNPPMFTPIKVWSLLVK